MEERRENIMGTQPINRLLPSMAFPIMLSMLVQALYNVVDSVFVSMVSENALTSVSLAFPVQNLMIAVSVGTALSLIHISWNCTYFSSILSILNITGLVPSEQQAIIVFSSFIQPFIIEPPCSPV